MDWTWALRGLAGGAIIGASASLLLVLSGRVAGISGIVGGLLGAGEDRTWRALFVGGLLLGGALAMLVVPGAFAGAPPAIGIAIAAGLLVGVGTKLGSGCTSGHGVCGLSRLSARSLVATLTFIATGAISVLAARALGVAS
jgi:uncharacterized membrane protein YedE/YeeE